MTKSNTDRLAEQMLNLFSSRISDQAVCLLDELGTIQSWNDGATHFFQFATEDILGKPVSVILPGLDPIPLLKQAITDRHAVIERALRRKNGSTFQAFIMLEPVYIDDKLQGFAFIARSLAYTKKTQYRFNDGEETVERPGLFQQLIEYSYSGITLFDAELNFIYRSPSAARITGFNDLSRSTITFSDIVHPADQPRIKKLLDQLLVSPGKSMTCRLKSRHYDGHYIDLEGIFTNWLQEPHIAALVLNFRDITEQQRTEDTLKQTINELSAYKYALDAAAIVAVTDQKGIIRSTNSNFCNISGYTETELIGQDHRIVNSGYHDQAFIRNLWRTIAKGEVWKGDLCNRRKDGTLYWVDTTIIPFLNDHGKPYQYMAIRFDRTEAKLAKQELIEKNKHIGSLLESINDGFIALDHELRYTYVNQRICEMVGLTAAAMLGKNIWDLFPEAVGSSTWRAINDALRTGLPVTNEDYYSPLNLWQENHIYPNEQGLSIFINDISWRKSDEEQKTLLADISHTFEQPLVLTELMQQVMHRLIAFSSSFCLAETWLIDRNGKQILLSARMAIDEIKSEFFTKRADFTELEMGQGLPGSTWSSGQVEFWENLGNHPLFLRRAEAKHAGLVSAFGVPLRYHERLIGVLLLGQAKQGRPARLTDALLSELGDHLGAAITRRQLENDLQDIFEAVPDIICIVGTDRYFKKVNPAMCILLGYSEPELLNMRIDDLVYPDDLNDSRERMRRFISGELSSLYFENRYCSKDGKIIYLAWTAVYGKEKNVVFCVAKNISDKKELEQLLHKASDLARIGSWEINLETGQIFWSDITADIMQVAADFKPFRSNVSTLFTKVHWELLDEALILASEDGSSFDLELECISAEQQPRWVRILGEGEFKDRVCIRIYGSVQDIDVRKRAEQELQRQTEALQISHQHYADLFQLSPLPKFVFDLETLAYLDVNKAAVNHYGYSREEFLSMTLRDIRPENEIPRLEEVIKDAGRSSYFYQPGTFTHLKKDGTHIRVEITSSAIDYKGRKARIALAVDVTERVKHLDAIQVQNQQLREIAWMHSHTIRAPLSRIMGLLELLQHSAPNDDDSKEILEFMNQSANELDQVICSISTSAKESDLGQQ